MGRGFLVLTLLLFIGVGVWYGTYRFEGQKPSIRLEGLTEACGNDSRFSLEVSDLKSGLRRIRVELVSHGKEKVLFEKEYESGGAFSSGLTKGETVQINIQPKAMSIPDGPAILHFKVSDFSWRRWWHGNQAILEKPIVIDTRPPSIELISQTHNIRQGGCGLVIYRLSEDCALHGAIVGDNFFPGYGGYFDDKRVYLCFFALTHTQGRGTALKIRGVDNAGNEALSGFSHHIRNKVFKEDKIELSEAFLNSSISNFQLDANSKTAPAMERFLFVNRTMRDDNELYIKKRAKESEAYLYWREAFGCLPRAQTRATFADLRHYYYKGLEVDRQRHFGVDLASTAHADVPAFNNGKIAFCGTIGIYGQTVMIDHGFGLFSLYSHLSRVMVKEGEKVVAGQLIGITGTTGLAGGDHLHYGMLLHNTWVDPIEWWDKDWIRNNITGKIDAAAERYARAE